MVSIRSNNLALLGAGLLAAVSPTTGFNIAQPSTKAFGLASFPRVCRSSLCMADYDDSYPSDSSEDSHFDVDVEADAIDVANKPSTESEGAVSSILSNLPTDITGDISSSTRAEINEAILKLEAVNPTDEPAYSPLINGVWALRYAGGYSSDWALASPTRQIALFLYSGGYSPGLFALGLAQKLPSQLVELGELEISISRAQPRIEAKIGVTLLGGSEQEIVVKARLEEDSPVRFTETYESASVLGNLIDLPDSLQYARDLYVSYVDEDILVVRDASGVPEILVRK